MIAKLLLLMKKSRMPLVHFESKEVKMLVKEHFEALLVSY